MNTYFYQTCVWWAEEIVDTALSSPHAANQSAASSQTQMEKEAKEGSGQNGSTIPICLPTSPYTCQRHLSTYLLHSCQLLPINLSFLPFQYTCQRSSIYIFLATSLPFIHLPTFAILFTLQELVCVGQLVFHRLLIFLLSYITWYLSIN